MPVNPFKSVLPKPRIKHSMQNLSHSRKTSFKIGYSIPNMAIETIPSDIVSCNSDMLVKLSPLKYPVFQRIHLSQHYFQVPLRLILGEELYQKFLNDSSGLLNLPVIRILCGVVGEDDTPEDVANAYASLRESLIDYLGYQVDIDPDYPFTTQASGGYYYLPLGNGLKLLAYQMVWANYFADETLEADAIANVNELIETYRARVRLNWENEVDDPLTLDENDDAFIGLRSVSYSKDYFTSAAIQPQRGEDVMILNGQTATIPSATVQMDPSHQQLMRIHPQDVVKSYLIGRNEIGEIGYGTYDGDGSYSETNAANIDPNGSLFVPSSQVTVGKDLSVRDLWKLEQIQRFRDIDNIFGTRIIEKLYAHFGVVSSDARLQLPRYLGGSRSMFNVSEVLQTSSSTEDSALGSYAGKASTFNRSRGFRNLFIEEHSILIGIMAAVPEALYTTGLERFDLKRNNLDFAYPEFNNIGYQPIDGREIFLDNNASTDDWAYQPRYSEYRHQRSLATGAFRYDPLVESWAMSRNFSELPPYNADFVHVDRDAVTKVFSTNDAPFEAVADVYHHVRAFRPISALGISSMHL